MLDIRHSRAQLTHWEDDEHLGWPCQGKIGASSSHCCFELRALLFQRWNCSLSRLLFRVVLGTLEKDVLLELVPRSHYAWLSIVWNAEQWVMGHQGTTTIITPPRRPQTLMNTITVQECQWKLKSMPATKTEGRIWPLSYDQYVIATNLTMHLKPSLTFNQGTRVGRALLKGYPTFSEIIAQHCL